ncbi:MAG: ABC transporter substrate-binding protein [Spirochaetaceae bacterium]|nr:ABC transporter substrate-binding protein [Spirochaetaceae bacterium]
MKRNVVFTIAVLALCVIAMPAMAAGSETKLTVWYAVSGDSGEAFKAMLEKYDAANDDVSLQYSYSGNYGDTATKVSAALVSNTAPDVALMAAGPLYTGARNDFFIESKINDSDFNKNDIFPGVWEYAEYNGRICAVPYGISTPVLFYNKAIMEKAGINMKNPPKTWDEFFKVAEAAQTKGNITGASDFWGFDVTDVAWLYKSMLSQNGNTVIKVKNNNVSPAFDDEKSVEVATFWKKLVDAKLMPVGQHSNAEKKFLSGNLAFLVASSARIARWAKDPSLKVGAIPMPYFKKPSVALGGNVLIILAKDQKVKEEAWKLVKYLARAENQTGYALKTGYLPIRKSGIALPEAKETIEKNEMFGVAFDQLDYAWSYWHFEQMGTMDQILVQVIDSIERNTMSPKDALQKGAAELQAEIDG